VLPSLASALGVPVDQILLDEDGEVKPDVPKPDVQQMIPFKPKQTVRKCSLPGSPLGY